MRDRIETTVIADCMGEEHQYSTTIFGAEEGSRLGLLLAKVIAGPFAQFVAGVGDLDDEVDLTPLEDLPQKIINAGGFDLFCRILKFTKRAFHDGEGNLKWAHLKHKHEIDRIYAGNLSEMLAVCKWVVMVNYVPFSPDGSRQWSNLLAGFMGSEKSADEGTNL